MIETRNSRWEKMHKRNNEKMRKGEEAKYNSGKKKDKKR